ncbi:MAG TPA: phosphoribosyl-AMP cyclohydrolase [Acidimicrobiales bacterium]|nr:phosphoribosyl-AMP cyclohydrolase [Acidimicrobiales bacterium]
MAPDTVAPDTAAPDTAAPDTVAPDTVAPDTAVPSPPPVPAGRVATPVPFEEADLDVVAFGPEGLVAAVVQDAGDRAVLMVAYMDREALRRTLSTGRTWFWSRSRREYWQKGETSGDRQWVREVRYDCDGDALLVVVDQDGAGACHTGARTCFFRAFGPARPAPGEAAAG